MFLQIYFLRQEIVFAIHIQNLFFDRDNVTYLFGVAGHLIYRNNTVRVAMTRV